MYRWRMSRWRLILTIGAVAPAMLLCSTAGEAQQRQAALQQEIAEVEQQVDSIEADALATMPSLVPGSPQRLPLLGKILFFDKALSVHRNEACAFCHMPQTGFQGAIESLNQGAVAQPGSVRTRFSLRKPPSAAYAAFSPPLFYADKPGEAKCSRCFIGGNFWDLRATGLRLQSPTAMQAEGSPLNPTEMANPDPACVVRRMSERPYKGLFESVWGPRAFEVAWPDDVDALCSRPNDNPASSIGSEVPGPNTTPLVVKLGPADRERVQSTFDQMGEAIAAYEASSEVSPFSSKFDAYLAGKAELSVERFSLREEINEVSAGVHPIAEADEIPFADPCVFIRRDVGADHRSHRQRKHAPAGKTHGRVGLAEFSRRMALLATSDRY